MTIYHKMFMLTLLVSSQVMAVKMLAKNNLTNSSTNSNYIVDSQSNAVEMPAEWAPGLGLSPLEVSDGRGHTQTIYVSKDTQNRQNELYRKVIAGRTKANSVHSNLDTILNSIADVAQSDVVFDPNTNQLWVSKIVNGRLTWNIYKIVPETAGFTNSDNSIDDLADIMAGPADNKANILNNYVQSGNRTAMKYFSNYVEGGAAPDYQ